MKRLWGVFALVLLSAAGSYAQNGMIQLPPVLINAQGQPLAGVNVAVCSSLTTSVAAVTNNIATLTVSSTTGFTAGMTLNVSGFTGADTYFNVSAPIVSLSSTTLSYALTHANASASSNGSVYQTGNSSTPCAPLATLYVDNTTTTTTANPFTSTGLGNVIGWVAPGYYHIQSYGTGVTTTVQQVSTSCVPSSTVGACGVTLAGTNVWTGTETHSGSETFSGTTNLSGPTTVASPVLNGTLTGTGIQTKVQKVGTGSGNYTTPADTNFHDVDASDCSFTNHSGLCATLTIPVGWVLTVDAIATVTTATAAATVGVAILDTSNLIETQVYPTTLGQAIEAVLTWNIVGDGASHTIKLEYKTFTGADSAIVLNSSSTFKPVMHFTLAPSN